MSDQTEQGVEPSAGYTVKPRSAKSRANQTVRDLVLSMAVVGLFVAFLYVMVLRPTPTRSVSSTSRDRRRKPRWLACSTCWCGAPRRLAGDVRAVLRGPTQDTGQWYNGYVSPAGEFAAVVQQDYDAAEFVKTQTKGRLGSGHRRGGGQPWTIYLSADGADRSLVREGGDATIVVTGTLPQAQLEQFAATLRSAATS